LTSFWSRSADDYPFRYDALLAQELAPYLARRAGRRRWFKACLNRIDRSERRSIDFLVAAEPAWSHQDIAYLIRMEPGVQTPEETLTAGFGLLPRLRPG